ncbi:MAG: CDP-alcohol phosphatidyltransferase family protein [Gemmatimonadaceae bacterium]
MANLLSLARLLSVPCMLVAAGLGSVRAWIALFACAIVSDAIDGPIARARHTVSERGAVLDSVADCALYLTVPAGVLLLFPWVRAADGPAVGLVVVGYATPVVYGFLKFRRLTSYHTIAARVSGVLLCSAFLWLLATRVAWPLYIATVVLVLSALEEIAITRTLPVWRPNVPSLRHALREVRIVPMGGHSPTIDQQSI